MRDRGTDPPTEATDDKAAAATPAATEHHQAYGVAGQMLSIPDDHRLLGLLSVGGTASVRAVPPHRAGGGVQAGSTLKAELIMEPGTQPWMHFWQASRPRRHPRMQWKHSRLIVCA